MGQTELPTVTIPSVVLPSFSSLSPSSSSASLEREGEEEVGEVERAARAEGVPIAYGRKAHAKFVTAVQWSGSGLGKGEGGGKRLLASASSDNSVILYEK
jgi:hypothetical protein